MSDVSEKIIELKHSKTKFSFKIQLDKKEIYWTTERQINYSFYVLVFIFFVYILYTLKLVIK